MCDCAFVFAPLATKRNSRFTTSWSRLKTMRKMQRRWFCDCASAVFRVSSYGDPANCKICGEKEQTSDNVNYRKIITKTKFATWRWRSVFSFSQKCFRIYCEFALKQIQRRCFCMSALRSACGLSLPFPLPKHFENFCFCCINDLLKGSAYERN